jgi:hypothetical protein
LISADKHPDDIPRLTGNSVEDVFAFLVATVEHQRDEGIDESVIYTPFVELETQEAVTSRLEAKGLHCTIHLRGSGLDWYFFPGSSDPEGDYYAAANAQTTDIAPSLIAPPIDDSVSMDMIGSLKLALRRLKQSLRRFT